MAETYISLEEAALLEEVAYNTLVQRLKRNPKAYKTKTAPRQSGKDRVLVAVSSLSQKARQLYRAEKKAATLQGDDILLETIQAEQLPWYVEVDYNWYISNYGHQYQKALELADLMREFCNYTGDDKTGFSVKFAEENGLTQRTLYRMSESYLSASMWSLKYEKLTGQNYDYFKVMALCRKPKTVNTFPSLSDELKALIENIWFDRKFRANRGTIEMLYSKAVELYETEDKPIPSYQTVARYIRHLMENENGRSAAYLAERGTRDWKNKMMVKGERDTKSVPVLGIVQSDAHTFDCWVSYTHPNGKTAAIRPTLVAWIDTRSRFVGGDVICHHPNAQIIKQSFIKFVYGCGTPEYILIDNGKDFTAKEMTGRARTERHSISFDSELVGFYKSLGIKDDMRSLPYQPWSKGQIERFFGTVCRLFSKWIDSYTGTLTASKTICKVQKDVKGMLERGELLTMQEFYTLWHKWLNEVYHVREHGGLKKAGERWVTPLALFENAEERYNKPAPPESYAELLLMKSHRVYVGNTGIRQFKQTYMCEALMPYIGQHVDIKYNPEDTGKIYCYTTEGRKIGEAASIEQLKMGYRVSSEQLSAHKQLQNRQLKNERERLDYWRTPYEQRQDNPEPTPQVVGGLDLTIGNKPQKKVVSLPQDNQYRQELKEKRKKNSSADFYDQRGQAVLDRISKLG